MKRSIIFCACVLALALVLGLAGFSLADSKTAEGDLSGEDRMVGVFITTEPLDLFDMEAYFADNAGKITSGGELTGTENYQGRLYAEKTTDEYGYARYEFPGLEGIAYFSFRDGTGLEAFWGVSSGEGLCDVKTHYSVGDTENGVSLEATVYISADGRMASFYTNPVYQTADGSIYVLTGSGLSFDSDGEGVSGSQTMDSSSTLTENGKSTSDSTHVSITYSTMFPPKQVTIVQLDGENRVLSSVSYAPEETPDSITPEAEAEYIVVKTEKTAVDGSTAVSRELFSKDDNALESFFTRDDGICVMRSTTINWG